MECYNVTLNECDCELLLEALKKKDLSILGDQSTDHVIDAIEEVLLQADFRTKYNQPNYRKITCKCFGDVDGMDGSCHYCMHDNPYQFEMCSDESWKNNLIKGRKFTPMSEDEAIEFINTYKRKHFSK